jgi:hypothetical protein
MSGNCSPATCTDPSLGSAVGNAADSFRAMVIVGAATASTAAAIRKKMT